MFRQGLGYPKLGAGYDNEHIWLQPDASSKLGPTRRKRHVYKVIFQFVVVSYKLHRSPCVSSTFTSTNCFPILTANHWSHHDYKITHRFPDREPCCHFVGVAHATVTTAPVRMLMTYIEGHELPFCSVTIKNAVTSKTANRRRYPFIAT